MGQKTTVPYSLIHLLLPSKWMNWMGNCKNSIQLLLFVKSVNSFAYICINEMITIIFRNQNIDLLVFCSRPCHCDSVTTCHTTVWTEIIFLDQKWAIVQCTVEGFGVSYDIMADLILVNLVSLIQIPEKCTKFSDFTLKKFQGGM